MNALIQTLIPWLIMYAMLAVGMEVTIVDLSRILHLRRQVALSLLGQLLLLPLWAALLIGVLRVDPAVAGGLMLVACAPQALISNYFCVLARSDVSLAVALTAASSALAVLTTPFIAWVGFHAVLDVHTGIVLPVLPVLRQLAQGLFIPLVLGMAMRHYRPVWVAAHRRHVQGSSMAGMLIVLTLILIQERTVLMGAWWSITSGAVLFTLGAAALGYGLARWVGWPRQDVVTLVAAFPARSLSTATLISVNVLEQSGFLAFAAVFFVAQAVVMTPLMVGLRRYAGN